MLSDKKGRFWLATDNRGLFRTDNPNDDEPKFVNFSTAEGLSSNRTFCLLEDDFGRIYVGTGRGINRLEPERQRVKIFTQADGLPGNIVSECHKSPDGKLWFSSNNSLIQFGSQADAPSKPPPIFIDSLSINGNERNVSELGETEIKNSNFHRMKDKFKSVFSQSPSTRAKHCAINTSSKDKIGVSQTNNGRFRSISRRKPTIFRFKPSTPTASFRQNR